MLDLISRGAIVASTALCVAAAVALAPTVARSAIAAASLPLPELPHITRDVADDALPIGRDPFAEPAASAPAPATLARSASSASSPSAVALGIAPLPSNLADETIPAIPGEPSAAATEGLRVTAVVTGAHPYAMIERAGVHEIKGLGDRIGHSAIVGIDLDGVRLDDGSRVRLEADGAR
jgi:hypothetical protein